MIEPLDAPSPNFDARVRAPDMIILHYTGMESGAAALGRLRDPEAKVSAHYVVEEDGRVFALVPEDRRAWHAGVSFWRGERDINGCSIGVEIVNPGHEFGYRDFPSVQVEAVIALLDDMRRRWSIPDARILGHSDVAPARKEDPGERFPWARLAASGHGLWVDAVSAAGSADTATVQQALAAIGYEVSQTGVLDPVTRLAMIAFQRHWVQSRIDGELDGPTLARLAVIAALSRPTGS